MGKKLRKCCKHQINIKLKILIIIELQIIIQILIFLLIIEVNMNFMIIINKTWQIWDKNKCNRHVHHLDLNINKKNITATTTYLNTINHHHHQDNYN